MNRLSDPNLSQSADINTKQNTVPNHIAIIMDGNGRWANKRFLPRIAGHAKGFKAIQPIVESCLDKGIKYLTLFAFSSENWRRPTKEVSFLMLLFKAVLKNEVKNMCANNVRLKVVGDLSKFDTDIQKMIESSEKATADNTAITLTICANFGGRWDMVQAANKILQNKETASPITEELLTQHLAMAYAPSPDLLIRTGGDTRISNFLLWQLAYTELYFTDSYWPDFGISALEAAIASYQNRERRFGRTSEQLVE